MPGSIRFNNLPSIDPLELRDEFLRMDPPLPIDNWWGKVNSFRCPLGPDSGKSFILMRHEDVLKLKDKDPYRWDLIFKDGEKLTTFKGIYLMNAVCIAPGWEDDKDSPYLCELADGRHTLQWVEIDKGYNLRDDDGALQTASLNGGTEWTWEELAESLWDACVTGEAYPGLPFAPEGTPGQFAYWSTSAWKALNHFLTRLGCAIKLDPTANLAGGAGGAGQLSIIRLGADDVAGEEAKVALQEHRLWDDYAIEPEHTNWPKSVTVRFKKIPCPDDGTTMYSTVTTNDTEALENRLAVSEIVLDDDLPSLTSNAAARTTRAAERASDYFRKLRNFNRRDRIVYAGIREEAFTDMLGRQFVEVAVEDRGGGYKTTVQARPDRWLEEWAQSLACCCQTAGGGGGGDLIKLVDTDTYHQLSLVWNRAWLGATGAITTALGNMICTPFVMPDCTVDRLAIQIGNSGNVGEKGRIGIYQASSTTLQPSTLIVDGGEFNADAAIGSIQEVTVSASLSKDTLYWAVVRYGEEGGGSPASVAAFKYTDLQIMDNSIFPLGLDRSAIQATGLGILKTRVGWHVDNLGALAALPASFPGGGQYIVDQDQTEDGMIFTAPPIVLARLSS